MNFALLAPLGLAALVALAVPILIHLVRRIELRTTDFAALRWISERIRPQRRIRFERPWLLLLRLVLLAFVALLLARPVLDATSLAKAGWVVVAPGADLGTVRSEIATASDWRWLAPGFPPVESSPESNAVPLASLLREVDSELPRDTALTVVVPGQLAGLDGERPVLSRAVAWHVVPGAMASRETPDDESKIALAVRYPESAASEVRFVRAAVDAWNAREPGRYALDAREESAAIGDDTRWLVWLGAQLPANVETWIERGGVAVVADRPKDEGVPVWSDADGRVIARARAIGNGRLVAFTGSFAPGDLPVLLDADFPTRLRDLLRKPSAPPDRAVAEAMRPPIGGEDTSASSISHSAKPLDAWIAVLIAALFLVERIVATRERVAA